MKLALWIELTIGWVKVKIINLYSVMNNLLQKDPGSLLLSIAVILGWIGIGSVFLRILTISLKKILEAIFKNLK